jgi:hypothetical protein
MGAEEAGLSALKGVLTTAKQGVYRESSHART